MAIKHKKTGTIADWTQADIDIQIALGNLPPGTTPLNILLTSDWNDNHAITNDVDFAGFKAVDLADPISAQDAATKAYVDSHSGGTIGGSIATNQVAVGSGANTIAGSSVLTFDGTTFQADTGSIIKGQYSNLAGSAFINPDGSAVFGGGGAVIDNAGNLTVAGFKLPTGATSTYVLTSDSSGNGTWQAGGGGGGGTPGGSPTNMQYNVDGTNFGGLVNSGVDPVNGYMGIGTPSPQAMLHVTPKPTDTVSPASSLSVTFNLSGSPLFTADGTSRSFTVYAYRTDVTPTIYEATGINNTQGDPNDGQGYEADLSWAASGNATGYIIYYTDASDSIQQYVDVGNVTSIVLDGSISWSGGMPTLFPTSISYLTAQLDGPFLTINNIPYVFPDSSQNGFLLNNGAGNLDFELPNLNQISAINNEIVFGSGGILNQSANGYFDGTTFRLNGDFELNITNDGSSSGTLNNYNVAGSSGVRFGSGSAVTLNGLSAPSVSGLKYLTIIAASNTVTLANENAGSTSTNRITTGTGGSLIIPSGTVGFLKYNPLDNRWVVVASGKPDVTVLANTWALKQTLAASITSAASLNIPSGTAPSSPVDGDEWYDSTQKNQVAFLDGIKQVRSGTLFAATTDKTVTNTSSETSIIGTGVGTATLPTNFFVAGKTVRIIGGGAYSTALTPGNLTIKIKYGSIIVASVVITNLLTSASSVPFLFEAYMTCRTTGSSGTIQPNGSFDYTLTTAGAWDFGSLNNGATTATINTTTSNLLDITATWATPSTSNIIKNVNALIEILN